MKFKENEHPESEQSFCDCDFCKKVRELRKKGIYACRVKKIFKGEC